MRETILILYVGMFLGTRGHVTFTGSETTPESDCNLQIVDPEIGERETVSVRVTNCTSASLQHALCQICEFHQSVTVNVSWNNIKQLRNVECNCSGILEIDLSNNHLALLGANSFIFLQSARRIILAGNNIYQLKERAFVGLEMLELLDLSRNMLQGVPLNLFDGALNLRELNLSFNELNNIAKDVFQTLHNLEMIDLSFNRISFIDNLAFQNLGNLKSINLSGNKLSQHNLGFINSALNLTELNLSENLYSQFQTDTLNNFNVRTLTMSRLASLRFILNGAFRNSEYLQEVDLSENINLIFIEDKAFQKTPRLKHVDVSYTKLKAFPLLGNSVEIYSHNVSYRLNDSQLCDNLNESQFTSTNYSLFQDNTTADNARHVSKCFPRILSDFEPVYTTYVGQRIQLECFAVSSPKPNVYWERGLSHQGSPPFLPEVLSKGYFMNLAIRSLGMSGQYRCVAERNNHTVFKTFNVTVKHTHIGIKVLTSNSHSVLLTWNRTHHLSRYVVMHRAYETISSYIKQNLNGYWKVFLVSSLKPSTEYEICIATLTDDSDRTCIRTKTQKETTGSRGIHHNTLIITALSITGFLVVVFVFTTVYRCADKVRVIRKQHVFIVGSESRECFADVSGDSNYTFENHHTDLLIDSMQKTEL